MLLLSLQLIVLSVILLFTTPAEANLECPSADLTGDCYVDLADLAVMAEQWLTGEPSIYNKEFWNRQQMAQFHSIEVALQTFGLDFGDYPPSSENLLDLDENPPDPFAYGGAQKLAEAVIGWDLLGFHPKSRFRSDGMGFYFSEFYPVYQTTEENLDQRRGPYIQFENANPFRLGDIYANTSPMDPNNIVLCDVFKRKRHSEKMTGMPILYFRARTKYYEQDYSNTPAAPLVDGIEDDIYYYRDNMNLLALGTPGDGSPHVLCGDDTPADWKRFEDMILNENITVMKRPYRSQSYILLSAGRDGIYGTADDIANFHRELY